MVNVFKSGKISLLFLLVVIVCSSCGGSAEEKTIEQYLTTQEGANVEIKDVVKVRDIKGRDSLGFYLKEYSKNFPAVNTKSVDTLIVAFNRMSDIYKQSVVKFKNTGDSLRKANQEVPAKMWDLQASKTNADAAMSKVRALTLERYQTISNQVLAGEYQCKYSGKDKKEITKSFFLSPAGTKVLASQ
jgi:hypothetical protein